jgi:hypothetical protein
MTQAQKNYMARINRSTTNEFFGSPTIDDDGLLTATVLKTGHSLLTGEKRWYEMREEQIDRDGNVTVLSTKYPEG